MEVECSAGDGNDLRVHRRTSDDVEAMQRQEGIEGGARPTSTNRIACRALSFPQ